MASMSGTRRKDLIWHRATLDSLRLDGKHAAVIGGTGGLGRAIARLLAERGAEVTVVGQTFRDEGTPRLRFIEADLSSMQQARRVAGELDAAAMSLVLLTTGIFAAPVREVTSEGLERDMAVSYLSRLAIVRSLAPRLDAEKKPRVFIMGFPGTGQRPALDDLNAEKKYSAMGVHMQTVAGNEALVLDSARRYPALRFFGLNPGLIKTDIRGNFLGKGSLKHRITEALIGLLTISPAQYAARIVPLLLAPELDAFSGAMFNQKGDAILASPRLDPDYVAALVATSEALLVSAQEHVAR